MAKQLNVNLSMTADTKQAKTQLEQLQQQLQQLINSTASKTSGLGLTKDLNEGIEAATQLKIILQQATSSTGKLDLGQFSQELKKNNIQLKDYATKLNQLGPEGQKTFAQIARAISTAEIPLKKSNAALQEFATTLKNTARWQISSSILHGFMGTLSSAYGYAQRLNSSLNEIRIVTGQSEEQMAKFAEQANKAAQSLSSTTTAYSNAALIFYQQGLDDKAVKERTDTVIKMANVTGDSAEDVSSYMTAIWENFADGSKSLEYYADVITRLGADTAASSAEIAEGIESFASIGETIGLSYEYATSALTTIVAKTRASASEVGNGLRTIFSRLQNLSLGETLDDGTDLTKYSKALETVGVSIKDASGELKSMDSILDDLAGKWDTLDQAEKVALANTVGGVRQYTKLISLMDNWDFMKQNIASASNSEGSLQEQADIYAESWEGAKDRVTAAAESIYSSLINDDFFITMLNVIEKLLHGVQDLIDGLGGLPGVLTTIGAIALRVFGDQISEGLSNTFYNLTYNTQTAKEEILQLRNTAAEAMKSLGDDSIVGSTSLDVFSQQGKLQSSLIAKTEELRVKNVELTSEEQMQAQLALDLVDRLGEEAIAAAQVREEQEKITTALEAQANQRINAAAKIAEGTGLVDGKAIQKNVQEAKRLQIQYGAVNNALIKMRKAGVNNFGDTADYAKKLEAQLKEMGIIINDQVKTALNNIGKVKSPEQLKTALDGLQTAVDDLGADAQTKFDTVKQEAQTAFEITATNAEEAKNQTSNFNNELDRVQSSATVAGSAALDQADKLNNLGTAAETAGKKIDNFHGKTITFSDGIVALGSSIMSTAMAIQSIKSLGSIWADDDATIGEKILTTMTTLGMVIPTLTNAFSQQNLAKLAGLKIDQSAIVTKLGLISAEKLENELTQKGVGSRLAHFAASKLEITGETSLTAAILKKIAAQMLSNWYYAAAVAVILILVGTIALLIKAYNADAEAAKKANEEAQQAAEAAQDAQEKYSSLMDTIADYKDAKDALSTLTQGTDEWKEAVSKVNEQVLELMSSYKGLAQYVTNNDGILSISDEGLAYLQKTQLEAVTQANMVAAQTQIKANNAQNKSDVTDVSRSIGYRIGSDYYTATSSEINKTMAAINSGGNAIFESLDTFTSAMNEQGVLNSKLIEALYNNRDKLTELTNAVNDNTKTNSILKENIASTYLSDNETYNSLSGDKQNAINKLIGKDAVDTNSQAYKDALKTYNSENDATIQAKYAELMGWELNGKAKNKNNGTGVYKLTDGTEYTVDDSVARAALAQADALKATSANLEIYVQNLQSIEQSGNKIAAGLGALELGFAGGEGGSLTAGTRTQLSALSSTAGLSFDENGKYVASVISDDTQNEILSQWDELGYESAQAYADALGKAVEDYNATEANLANNMGSDTARGFYEGLEDKLKDQSLDAKQSISNLLDRVFQESGLEATNSLSQIFASAGDDAGQLASILTGIDWTSGDGAEQLKTQLQDAGLSSYYASDAMQAFIAQMESASTTANNLISRFEQLRESISSIKDITEDLKIGSVISDEDYNTLIGYNSSLKDMFMMTSDGWKFVGDVNTLNTTLKDSVQDIDEMKSEFEAAANAAQKLGNYSSNGKNFDYSTGTYADSNGQSTGESVSDSTKASTISQWSQDSSYKAIFDQAGVSADYAKELADYVVNATEAEQATDEYANKVNQLNSIFTAAGTLQENYNNGIYDSTHAEELWASTYISNLADLQKAYENETISAETYDKVLTDLANNASSFEELQQIKAAALSEEDGAGLDTVEYGNALSKLAENYSNCADEIEDYNKALLIGDQKQIDAAISALELAEQIGELSERYDLNAETTENYAKRLSKSLGVDEKAAAKLAVANQRLDRGLDNLNDNLEDYSDSLKTNAKNSAAWSKTMDSVKTDLADLLDVADGSMLSDEFAEATLDSEDLKKALNGDVEAIDRLKAAAADDIIASIKANIEGANDIAQFQKDWDYLKANMEESLNPTVNQSDLITAFNDMIEKGNMTKDQIEAALSGLHVSANVHTEYVPQRITVPTTITEEHMEPMGSQPYEVIDDAIKGTTKTVNLPMYRKYTTTYDGQPVEVDGYVPKYTIEGTEGKGGITQGFAPAPSVTPSHSSTTSGKNSGSGGGGGSSKSQEHNSEKHKNPTDEKERYHVIKNQLEDLTSQYDRISKAKDKAFGSARLANLNKEIDAQKKLTQANKQYLDEIEGYLAQDKGTMASYGAVFDNNGTILNYDELVKQQVDAYNRAVDTFNAAYTDDEGAKAAFEAAQDVYDKFQDALSQYEETQDLFNEQTQTYIDSLNAERELLLERTQLQVELKVNVEEDVLNFLQYALDNIENKAYDCAEAFGYLNDMTAAYLGTAKAYEEGLRSLFANQGLSDADFDNFVNGNSATFSTISQMLSNGESAGFQSEDVETIRDYVKELISANENLQEVRQTVHDQILTVWDEWNEKLDDGISKLEHLQAIQESYVNIIDIVGQKNLGVSNAFMRSLSQQGIDQANDKLVAEKARYDALKKARDDAYATFEEQKNKGILSEEEIKMWEDSLHQMDEDVRSASEDFQSAWEDALTSINEAFEAEVDRIIEAYDDAAAGLMGSMSQLQEAFDRKSDLADQYLDDYEKIYQFSKLNRDIENSIDSTSNVKAKKELLELQSKINAYEEAGTEISEYQMQQLQQEYELKKAQIELEEASDAKSQVKMQRDSEGNYSYVYTANSDDVAKAEQNYEDKLHAMQQSNAEYINDLQSNMIQMEQDYQDKVKEIMTDTSLTAEERMAQLNELNDYYDEKMKFYISEAQLWEQNSQTLYEKDWMNYATMTGYKISEEDKWLDHWNETQLALLTGFDTLEDYQTNHNMNVANLLLASGEAFSTWQTNIEEAMNNAGTSLGTFEEDATDAMKTVAEESEKTKDQIKNDSKDMVDAVNDVVAAVANWETQYSKIVQGMLDRNTALAESFRKLIAEWSKFEAAENAHNSSSGNDNSSGSGSGSSTGSGDGSGSSGSGSGSGSGADNSDKIEGVAAAIWMDGSAAGWGNGSTRRQRLQEKGVLGAQDYINAHASNGDIYSAWASKRGQLRQFYYGSFDTGGYTGEWGLDGKLALLHEKELVLNADDTTNFLKAIDVVRQISDMIDLNALSSAGGLSSLFAATASSSSQNLQQEVHITAEFPNATDKDQISEAFSDLVNLASQYANRK